MKELSTGTKWAIAGAVFALGLFAEWTFAGHRLVVAANTFLLFPYLMLFAATSVREFGRVVAAGFMKFRVRWVSVHGIVLRRDEGSFFFELRPWDLTSHTIATAVGLENLRSRLISVIAGGPIANALMAGIGFTMAGVSGGSGWWVVWTALNAYCALASFVDLPFRGNMPNDAKEIACARGIGEGASLYFRRHVGHADGTDDTEREKVLRDLGYGYEAAVDRMLRLDGAGDFRGALRAVADARDYAAGDLKKRTYLDCCEASLNASDRLDVDRAKEVLPSEEAAMAHEVLVHWLEAAIRIACGERRWKDAKRLCDRMEAFVQTEGESRGPRLLRWIQLVGKWSERKARRASAAPQIDPSAESPSEGAEA